MSGFESVIKYIGLTMSVLYIAIGIALIGRAHALFNIPATYAIPLGSMLILYGIFRGYRIFRNYFQRNHGVD